MSYIRLDKPQAEEWPGQNAVESKSCIAKIQINPNSSITIRTAD